MKNTKNGISGYIQKKGGLFAKGSVDYLFCFFFMVILLMGIVMLYSASYPYAYSNQNGDSAYFLKKQIGGILLGGVAMLIISKINYKVIMVPAAILGSGLSVLLLVIARAMPAYNGTHRYIYIRQIGLQFQPSDIAKFTLILVLAWLLDNYHEIIVSKKPLNMKWAKKINKRVGFNLITYSSVVVLLCFGIIAVYAGLVLLGSHLSGTILIVTIGMLVMMMGEVRWKYFVVALVVGIIAILILSQTGLFKSYMGDRIYAWMHKDFDPLGKRWQTNQAIYAMGSGGFFGKGLGRSTQKFLYVAEPQNDMIFSIVVEELGFFGAAVIIIAFALLVWRGVVIGINSDTRFGALVAMGIVFQIAVQVILNIFVASDFMPNTGISLPFFSYGRTSMLVNMAEIGMVLSISRTSRVKKRIKG